MTSEVFFRKVKFWPGDPPPVFVSELLTLTIQNVDGINYFFTKKFGIYFVATSKYNVQPSSVLDVIYRMMKVFRDYCGVLNEESIRKNFVLIYEIIDEIIDFGHPQLVTTEAIRPFIVNEPILVQPEVKEKKKHSFIPKIFKQGTISSTAIQKPISKLDNKKDKKNEIFVDIFEKLTVSKIYLVKIVGFI